MAGCVGGDDRLGGYVRQQLRAAGVSVVKNRVSPDVDGGAAAALHHQYATPAAAVAAGAAAAAGGGIKQATTGTVMVFCTPDAQRSFLSCIPNDDSVVLSPELLRAAARSRLLVIEGYLLDLPGAAGALPALVEAAKAAGTVVALTCGDAGVGAARLRGWCMNHSGWFGGWWVGCWCACRYLSIIATGCVGSSTAPSLTPHPTPHQTQ